MKIKLSDIRIRKRIRKDVGDIDELAASIRRYGLLHPIRVKKTKKNYVLLAGHRRYLACKKLDETTIECTINQTD